MMGVVGCIGCGEYTVCPTHGIDLRPTFTGAGTAITPDRIRSLTAEEVGPRGMALRDPADEVHADQVRSLTAEIDRLNAWLVHLSGLGAPAKRVDRRLLVEAIGKCKAGEMVPVRKYEPETEAG